MIHPVVNVALVVTVIAFLARGDWLQLTLVGAAAGAGMLVLPSVRPRAALRSLWRLRFFYLSIALLYLWFTPGEAMVPALGAWSPSAAGGVEALRRVVILALIMTSVQIFLSVTTRDEQLAALRWWLRPLGGCGANPDRLAMRLTLVTRTLPRLRQLAEDLPAPRPGLPAWRQLAERSVALVQATLEEAETAPLPRVTLPALPSPRPSQWLPLLAAAVLLAAA